MAETIPIPTIHLFDPLDQLLIQHLKTLHHSDWLTPTLAKQWCVKDIAAHLLDGNIRSISMYRDAWMIPDKPASFDYEGIVSFLNGLNHTWVSAFGRMSPELIIEWLERTGPVYTAQLAKLDPMGQAMYSVAWAGQHVSQNWFHIAREYTEKWHHQMQIREATHDADMLLEDHWYMPYVATSMQALPHAFSRQAHSDRGALHIDITGKGASHWHVLLENGQATMTQAIGEGATSHIVMDGAMLWRLFSKQLDRDTALSYIRFEGNPKLLDTFLSVVAVMA